MKQNFLEIPLNLIDADENYRKTFNEKSLKELEQSIRANGIVQPLVLRQGENGRYKIIAGGRRFRAANMAGLVTVPAVVRDTAEAKVLELQIIENVQREGVPFMEEAYAFQKLRDRESYDVKEIAALIGKSEGYVYMMLKLSVMAPGARTIAENGWITKAVAWEIVKLKDEDHQTRAANELARTKKDKLIVLSSAKSYIADNFGDSDGAMRKQRVASFGLGSSNDFAANGKHHLVRFTTEQFEGFKRIVRGRTENAVLSEAVDRVMRDGGTKVAIGGG